MRPVRYCRSQASKWARALVCVWGGGDRSSGPWDSPAPPPCWLEGRSHGEAPASAWPRWTPRLCTGPWQVLPLRRRGRTGLWPHRHHHRHVSELLLPQVPADPLQPGSRPRAPRELKRGNRRKRHSRGSLAGSRAARPTGCTEEGLRAPRHVLAPPPMLVANYTTTTSASSENASGPPQTHGTTFRPRILRFPGTLTLNVCVSPNSHVGS